MKYINFISIYLTLFLYIPDMAAGLNPNKSITQYMQTVWTTKQGLPSDNITDVIQDKKGYIWIGTYDALIRFDGIQFETFTKYTNEEFKSTSVRVLYEDKQGNLWIGTNGDGLAKYNNGHFEMYTTEHGLPDNTIRQLFEDKSGTIWVGTTKGLAKWHLDKFVAFAENQEISHNLISMIYQTKDGTIWAATGEKGVFRYNGRQFIPYNKYKELNNNVILSLLEDSKGNLWFGTRDSGIYLIQDEQISQYNKIDSHPIKTINVIIEESEDTIWIGTDSGLLRYQTNSFSYYTENKGLNNNQITRVLFDQEGSLWLSTSRGGLCKLSDGKFLTISVTEGLIHSKVNAIIEDLEGNHWIGTDSGLSIIRNGKIINHSLVQEIGKVRIRHLFQDSTGTIWISTYSEFGVIAYKNKNLKFYNKKTGLSSNRCRITLEDKNGEIWIGTTSGLNRLNADTITIYNRTDGLANDYIMCLYEDASGNLWIGTDGGGVFLYNNKTFTNYSKKQGLASNVVFKIFADSSGIIWIATNGGVSRYENDQFANYTVKHGLFSDSIFQIIEDDYEQLWMTTNNGIFVMKMASLQALARNEISLVKTKNYDENDGLKGEVIATAWGEKDSKGRLWFPTMDGVAIIDPNNIPINKKAPPIFVEKVIVDNNGFPPDELKFLNPDNKRIVFDYRALSFVVPEKVQFQYRLKGFDNNWSKPTFKREASYTTLPPGEYVFNVKAANNDGIWSKKTAKVAFIQKPYFYQTVWFSALVVTSTVFMVVIVFFLRIKHLKKRQFILQTLVDKRTKQLTESEERYRLVVEFSPDSHIVHREGKILFINRAVTELLNLSDPEELINKPINNIISSTYLKIVEKLTEKTEGQNRIPLIEQQFQRLDGTNIDVEVASTCFTYQNKPALLTIARNITERKRVERLREDIDRLVRHDLKSPLSSIIGFARLLREISSKDEKQHEWTGYIYNNGMQMLKMIEQSLDFYKMEAGTYVLKLEAVDLLKLFRDIEEEQTSIKDSKSISMDYQLNQHRPSSKDSYIIQGESIYLKIMFTNLIKNALEASPENEAVTISITENEFHQIDIHNRGIIPDDIQNHFFDKYVTSGKKKGTGLGTYSALLIAKSHSGYISFKTVKEHGTILTVTLPRKIIS